MSSQPADYRRIAADVQLGRDVRIHGFVNLYGCQIGDETTIGTFVEIQKGAKIGDRCKISSHTFICEGVTIEVQGLRRARCHLHQRSLSSGDQCLRAASD